MKRKKKVITIISIILAAITVAGTTLGIVLTQKKTNDTPESGPLSSTHDEFFVKELFGRKVEDVIGDPELEGHLVNTTENYVMLESEAFDFAKQIDVGDGYSYLYFVEDTHEIYMIVHNYVEYTNDKDSKAEVEEAVANIEGKMSSLLGNATQPFMLMNTSGEFEDYSDLTLDQMIEKVMEGNTVMYTLFESNGMDYEMNIMFSDDTIYTTVWVAECVEYGEEAAQ